MLYERRSRSFSFYKKKQYKEHCFCGVGDEMDTLTREQSSLVHQLESASLRDTSPSLDKTIVKKDKKTKEDNILVTLKEALEALMKAQQEQEKACAATKTEQKTIEKKTEIKKDKDITVVVEDEHSKEKINDKFTEGILSITLDMDGFEKFHLQQYQQQLANYARFLAEYLDGNGLRSGKFGQSYTYSDQKEEEKPRTTEVQMMTFSETQDYVRSTVMNSMLGNGGGNYVDPNTKDSWELWRVFQHNQIMSFLYTSQWRH